MDNFDNIIKYDGGHSTASDSEPFGNGSEDGDATYVQPVDKKKRKPSVSRRRPKKKKAPMATGGDTQLETVVYEQLNASQDMFDVQSQSDGGDRKSADSSTVEQSQSMRMNKAKLASLVQKEECIWSMQHKLHSNINALNASWSTVASEMKASGNNCYDCYSLNRCQCAYSLFLVSDCKVVWKSLRDSLRYYMKKKKPQGKSGDSGCEGNADPDEQWEFSECMAFMMPTTVRHPRKTMDFGGSTGTPSSPATSASTFKCESAQTSKSNYDYVSIDSVYRNIVHQI